MPPPELINRYQKALLWQPTGSLDNYAQPVLGEPVEVVVRWNRVRTKAVQPNGELINLDATVVLNRTVAIDSLMWLAPLQGKNTPTALDQWYGWSGSGSAASDTELMVVKTYNETVDLKNRVAARTAGLMRFKTRED